MHRPGPTHFGAPFSVDGQSVVFSYFPLSANGQVLPVLYTASPWPLMRLAISRSTAPPEEQRLATACVRQAEDLFAASASAQISGAKPMLLYYSMFNIVKALAYAFGGVSSASRMNHGMTMPLGYAKCFADACDMDVYCSPHNGLYELARCLGVESHMQGSISIRDLAIQSVVGHRLFCRSNIVSERFISIRFGQIEIGGLRVDDCRMYVAVTVREEDVARAQSTPDRLAVACGLGEGWDVRLEYIESRRHIMLSRELGVVDCNSGDGRAEYLRKYVRSVKASLHRVVTNQGPVYRRYYLYVRDDGVRTLPQLLAVYAMLFYLGSMNRYQPAKFRDLLDGPDGPFVHEVLESQPVQLLYLLASEMCGQEIAKPSVVS